MSAIIAFVLAAIVVVRCFCVIHGMGASRRSRAYLAWLAFGLSYAVLCIAAMGAAMRVTEGHAGVGDWLWLIASSGLIIFYRRTRGIAVQQSQLSP